MAKNFWEDDAVVADNEWWKKDSVQSKSQKERTFGEALKDIGAGAVSGTGALVQLPGQLYGLATGDMSETGALGLGKEIQKYGEEMKSAGLKAREQERAQKIAEASQRGELAAFGTALGETLKDPGLLLNFLAEQAPQLAIPFGAGKLGAGAARLAGAGSKAGTVGTGAAVGAGAVAQGADIGAGTYEEIYKELIAKGIEPDQAKQNTLNLARASGAAGATLSVLANMLPGSRQLEKIAAGVPGKSGKIATAGKAVLGEIPSENVEEVGGKLAQNIAMQQVKPEQRLTEGLGETAAMATIGAAGMGTAAGALSRRAPEVKPPEEEKKPEAPAEVAEKPREEPTITPPVSLTGRTGAQLLQDQIRGEQNVGLMDAARVRAEEQDAIREQERQAREKEQARLDQEERDRQAAMLASQERARGLGLEGNAAANTQLLEASRIRAAEAEKQRAKEEANRVKSLEAQKEAERKQIESTVYSTDPLINARRQQDALAELEKKYGKPAEEAPIEAPAAEPAKPKEKSPEYVKALQDLSRASAAMREARRLFDEKKITQEQLTNLETQYKEKQKAFDAEVTKDVGELNEMNLEALRIADELEKLGQGNFATGLRSSAKRNQVKSLDFYKQKLEEVQKLSGKGKPQEKQIANVDTFFTQPKNKTEPAEKIALNATRSANANYKSLLDQTSEAMQALTDIANKSGLKIESVGTNAPQNLVEVRSAYSNVTGAAKRFVTEAYRVINRDKRANPKKLENSIADLSKQINAANDLAAAPEGRVQPEFVEAEPVKGEAAPRPQEVEEADKTIQKAEAAIRKEKRESRSLWTALRYSLTAKDVNDISPEFNFKQLQGEPGADLSTLVDNGTLDDFLPPKMRNGSATYDEQSSVEYIKDKLRSGSYLTHDSEIAIREMFGSIENAESLIKQYLEEKDVNLLLQEVADEQREINEPVEGAAAERQERAAEPSTGEEDLQASNKGLTYQPDPELLRVQNELKGKSLLQVSQWSVDNAPNSFVKLIAEKVQRRLREMERRGVKFEFKIHEGARREKRMRDCLGVTRLSWGESAATTGTKIAIELNGAPYMENQRGYPPGVNYETVMHELLHAATRAQLRFLSKTDPLVLQMKNLFSKVKAQVEIDRKAGTLPNVMKEFLAERNNALDNIDEMVSWGLTDREMQQYLDGIEVGKKSAFTRMIELIREVMGIGKPYETALERLARTTEDILDVNIRELEGGITSVGVSYGPGKARKPTITGDVLTQAEEAPSAVGAAKAAVQKALQPKPAPKVSGVPQDLQAGLDKVFGPHKKETIIDRIEGMKDRFWQRLAQGVADQYRTIKEYSEEAYIMARMSKTIDGALEGLMFHGEVFNDGGALNVKPKSKGMLDALKPLGNEVENYMRWVALNREAQLVASERNSSIDPELVQRRNELVQGSLNGKPRAEVYADVLKDMNRLNRSVLKVALDSGLIDEKGYDRFAQDIFYVPFYKVMEDGDISGAKTASGLTRQEFSKMLKGGEKQFSDLMENTLRNWSHIMSASMKNQAANASLNAAEKVNAAEISDSTEKGTVRVMRDGQAVYYKVTDPLLLDSITSIGYMGPKSKFLDVARDFKNMLQFGVTVSPAFKVRNLIRDSVSAMAISDLKKNPIANVLEGINLSDKSNPQYISALAGGAIFNFGSAYEGQQAKMIKRLLDMGVKENEILDTPEKIKKGLKIAWSKYQDLGNKSEAANRMALYKQMRDKGMSHLEASFAARDLLDFSMQGSFPAFRYLTQIVPFLNARVQGLYKLGKDGINPTARVIYNTATGKPIEGNDKVRAQAFSIVSSAVALASMALYAAFKDDEEFKKRDDWDRDNFWWFRLPGMDYAFRIPKPFEIGAFGTLVERTMDQIYDEGAEGKEFVKALERMATDTFAFNLPQMIKPMVDIYANRDSFTGSPIESAGMERLSKAERVTDNTSPLAIAVGGISNLFLPEKMELSPVQVDYLIKGYLGWLGAQASWVSHYAMMPFQEGTKPDNKWTDTMSAGFVRSLPATQARYVNAFYENSKEISQAYADMRHYAEIGDSAKVQQLLEEKGDKIAMAKFYDKTAKDLSEMRKAIRVISADKDMDGAQKREEIDRLKLLIAMLAEQAETARKTMKR